MRRRWQAGAVVEVGVGHAEALRIGIHQLHKGRFSAANPLGERNGRIVAGLHDHALDQHLSRYLRPYLHEGAGALGLPRTLADGHQIGELETAGLERMKDYVAGHELGQARGREALLLVALREHLSSCEVDQSEGARIDLGRVGGQVGSDPFRRRGPTSGARGCRRMRGNGHRRHGIARQRVERAKCDQSESGGG